MQRWSEAAQCRVLCGHESASFRRVVLAPFLILPHKLPPAPACSQGALTHAAPLQEGCLECAQAITEAPALLTVTPPCPLGAALLICFGKYWEQDIFRLQSSGSLDCQVPEAINSLG